MTSEEGEKWRRLALLREPIVDAAVRAEQMLMKEDPVGAERELTKALDSGPRRALELGNDTKRDGTDEATATGDRK